jgi:CNT family concentrative nucleoside transporter
MTRLAALCGIAVFIGIGVLLSRDRRRIPWRTVGAALGLQFALALLMLKTPVGTVLFEGANRAFLKLLGYSNHGAKFMFGTLAESQEIGAVMAFSVLPLIIFVAALMGLLLWLGVIQAVVRGFAWVFYKTLDITGVEAVLVSLQIVLGIEAVTGAAAYIKKMNEARLFTLMTAFMATIAGSVMAAYVSFGASAGHLMTASLLSAPAAIMMARLMMPDTTGGEAEPLDAVRIERPGRNPIEAVANGASAGLKLALEIGAMLIAFISIIYLLNDLVGISGLTLERLMGYALAPFALLIGIPPSEALTVGNLLGIKVVFTEFLSYLRFKELLASGALSPRSAAIATYALCGFTHFGSVAIMIGGLGGLVPEQKPVVTRLALKALAAAFLANCTTAAVAGLFL